MITVTTDRLNAAETFAWLSGRLVDRLRFASLFRGASSHRVVEAVRPYRGPVSQPVTVLAALHILDEANAFDNPMVADACDWLAGLTVDGGVPVALSNVSDYPRAWWWSAPEG